MATSVQKLVKMGNNGTMWLILGLKMFKIFWKYIYSPVSYIMSNFILSTQNSINAYAGII